MAGTLSGISCNNMSQHDISGSNNRINSSLNDVNKNKNSVSFNHYLSHNIKDNNNSHIQDDLSCPKSAVLAADNISQCCIDDDDSNEGSRYYNDGSQSRANNNRINNNSNSQLSINLDQVQINEQPSGVLQQKYPTMPGSRTCPQSINYPLKGHNEHDQQIMLNNCK